MEGKMIKSSITTGLLLLSLNVSAGNLEKFNIRVKAEGQDLIITATGEEQPPSLSDAVNQVLIRIIGTTMYRNDLYAPEDKFAPIAFRLVVEGGKAKIIGGNGFESSSKYPNFFNASLVKQAGLSIGEWITEVEKQLD
jgi:hypothetical protein